MDRSTQRHSLELLANTLKPIAALMQDAAVQEIMVNGPDNVWVERGGRIERYDAKISEIQIRSAISVLARLERKEAKEGTREGIIDSLGVVELVEFVQSRFGVRVDQQEVVPDNFDSVSRLAAYVRRKLAGA